MRQVQLEPQVLQGLLELQARLVPQVLLVPQVRRVLQVLLEPQARPLQAYQE